MVCSCMSIWLYSDSYTHILVIYPRYPAIWLNRHVAKQRLQYTARLMILRPRAYKLRAPIRLLGALFGWPLLDPIENLENHDKPAFSTKVVWEVILKKILKDTRIGIICLLGLAIDIYRPTHFHLSKYLKTSVVCFMGFLSVATEPHNF